MIPLRDIVILPSKYYRFKVGRPRSLATLEQAAATNQKLFLVTQRDPETNDPEQDQLYEIGIISELVRLEDQEEDGTRRVLVRGKSRARLISIMVNEGTYVGAVKEVGITRDKEKPVTEAMQRVAKLVQNYFPLFSDETQKQIRFGLDTADPSTLADRIVAALPLIATEDKQHFLETSSPFERLQRLIHLLETGNVSSQITVEPSIFIGHGRSPLWARVQLFLENELGLITSTYESETRVGESIVPLLEKLLTNSSFAVLVLTAEDQVDVGTKRARQNVIHEAGLFQGRLGFHKAVLLVQEGVEDFSNVAGLQHIRFSGDHIEHTFYELQRVLKREGMI